MRWSVGAVWLAVFLLTPGCGAVSAPMMPLPPGPPTAPTVDLAATIEPSPRTDPAIGPFPAATPIATASALRFVGWSPDSRWLAYRESTPAQVLSALGVSPEGTWVLYDSVADEFCVRADIEPESQLTWEPPDTMLLASAKGHWRSEPCGPLVPSDESSPTQSLEPSMSPDGSLLAATQILSRESGLLYLQTTLSDVARQTKVASAEWSIDERLGELGLGGEWVGLSSFLLYETLERGPLLLEASGEAQAVITDLLGLATLPSILGPEGYGWRASAAAEPGGNGFHLLLSGVGNEANFPPIQLYHSVNDVSEILPYRHPWRSGLSPDGRWLLMDARPDEAGYETHQVWMRPVDAAGGEWTLLAGRVDSDMWSSEMTHYAWQDGTRVSWQTFPSGERYGDWDAAPYAVRPVGFSPDGCRLAAEGNVAGEWRYALFVWDRCSE